MNTSAGRVFVVAEAGVNHNGSVDLARKLIDAAAAAGADAVKFQSFRAQHVASARAPKAQYQTVTTGTESQLEMLKSLELTESAHESLIAHAAQRGIRIFSTPFDLPSLELLTGRFGFEVVKIPSGEITNGPFLLAIARTRRRLIMSTGMSSLADVEAALGVLAFGLTAAAEREPGEAQFRDAFASDAGQQALRAQVTLLHCTTEYPAPVAETNLRAMDTLAAAFGLPVGFSDHTPGIHIAVAAVARGACLIEKHFTLDRALPGPDHAASLEPDELTRMVSQIRDVEAALGDGIKRATASELKNVAIARRSLVAATRIARGEEFSAANLTSKRPGSGITPMHYWSLIGQRAARDFEPDDTIAP